MPLICDLDLQIADETRLSKRVVYQVIECERGLCILVQGDPRNHSLRWNYWWIAAAQSDHIMPHNSQHGRHSLHMFAQAPCERFISPSR